MESPTSMPYADAKQAGLELAASDDYDVEATRLSLGLIAPDPRQPRKEFDGPKLAELAASIVERGVLQPITVRPAYDLVDGVQVRSPAAAKGVEFLIIAGERRFRACALAGLSTIPAIIRRGLSADEISVLQAIENLQRQDLSLPELSTAVAVLVERLGLGPAAKQLGKDKPWVSRHASLGKLRAPVWALVKDGLIDSVDVAHELHSLFDINESMGEKYVGEFRNPPAHRGSAPTRQMIRSAIQIEKQVAQGRKERAEEAERVKAQQGILSLAGQYGVAAKVPTEGGDGPDEHKAPPTATSARAAEVAYRHPQDSGLTWSGRGRMPVWVQEWKAKHGNLDGIDAAKQADLARERRESERARAQAYEQARKKAAEVSERLTPLAMQAMGLSKKSMNESGSEFVWLHDGRQLDTGYDDPVQISPENLGTISRAEDPMAALRYTLFIGIDGFTEPQLQQMLERLASGGDNRYEQPGLRDLHRFVQEFTEPSEGESIRNDWLYQQYVEWCKAHGLDPLSHTHFGESMPRLGYEKVRKEVGRSYLGIRPRVAA